MNCYKFYKPEYLLYEIEEDEVFDILFLDVQMPDADGFQVATVVQKKLPECVIIFVSSYIEYTIKAIEFSIFRYILKEQLDIDFNRIFEQAIKKVDSLSTSSYYIFSQRKQERINCKEIVYCFKDGKMSIIVTTTQKIKERKSLHQLYADLLSISAQFMMIERGYIVNLYHVQKISGNILFLKDSTELIIGNTFLKKVKQRIGQFWREKI